MKILLINPYLTFHPGTESKAFGGPMGLAYLAGMCEEHGHEVKILDMYGYGIDRRTILEDGRIRVGLGAEDLREFILKYDPRVVGVSSNYTAHEQDALDVLRMVKETNSDIFNVVGGANATSRPDIMMEHNFIDCLIQGEGEHLLVDVLDGLDRGASDFEYVFYRKQGRIIKKDRGNRIKDLDALPLPARHLLSWRGDNFIKLYAERYPWAKRKRSAPIVTSRGCPFTCSFCSVEGLMGRSYMVRSAQDVFDEIKYLHNKYQIKEFHFYDDIFTIQKKRLIELCRLVKAEGLDISFAALNGFFVGSVDRGLLAEMASAGLYRVTLPIESGCEDTIKYIDGKPIDLAQIKEVVNICGEMGIITHANFIIGFPMEKKQHIVETIDYASSLNLDSCNFFVASPLPKTRMEKDFKKGDYATNKFDSRTSTDYLSHYELNKLRRVAGRRFLQSLIFRVLFSPRYTMSIMKKVWLNGFMLSAVINLLILKVFFIASPPAILKNKKNDPAGENLW